MKRFLSWCILILTPVLITIPLLFFSWYLYHHTHQSFVHNLLVQLQRTDIERQVTQTFFTANKFQLLQYITAGFSFICLIGSVLFWYHHVKVLAFISRVIHYVECQYNAFIKLANSFSKTGKVLLLSMVVFLIIRFVFYTNSFAIQSDEAWNYNLFLSQHWFASIGAYNNYPLHNLLTWPILQIFGSADRILRLPSLLFGILALISILFSIQYLLKNEWISLSAAAIFVCLPVPVFYTMYARGVLLEVVFAMLVIITLITAVRQGFSMRLLVFTCILNGLGTYAMLSHPYFIVATSMALLLFGVRFQKKWIALSVFYLLGSCLISFILLTPMLLGTGLSPGIHVVSSQAIPSVNEIWQYWQQCSYFITGFHHSFTLMLIALIFLLFHKRALEPMWWFTNCAMLCLLLLPILIPLVTGTIPPERALGFLSILPVYFIALTGYFLFQLRWQKRLSFVFFSLMLMMIFSYRSHTHHFLNWSQQLDKQVRHTSQVMASSKIFEAYNDSRDFDYFIPGIEYYYRQQKGMITFLSSSPKSTRFNPEPPSGIACLILSKSSSKINTVGYQLILTVGDVMVYKRQH